MELWDVDQRNYLLELRERAVRMVRMDGLGTQSDCDVRGNAG